MQQLLFQWDVPTGAQAPATTSALFCRGIALAESEDNACLLCVGSSTGKIHTFTAGSAAQIDHNYDLCHHTSPIAALASGHTSSTTSSNTGGHLASCDDSGAITVFQAKSAGSFEAKHEWEGHGVPCIAVAFNNLTLIAAFCDGSVRLYSLVRTQPRFSCLHTWHRLLAGMCKQVMLLMHTRVLFIGDSGRTQLQSPAGCWRA